MSYWVKEQSEYSGAPQECFLFENLTSKWAYTSSKQNVIIHEDTYTNTHIKRSTVKNESDMFKTSMTVTIAADDPVALLFRTWLEGALLLTVYRQHYGDSDPVVFWSGKVSSCKWKGNEAELACTPLYTTLKAMGLARTYQRSCPHAQYDSNCRLNPADWVESVTITAINDNVIQFSGGFSANYFKGGSATVGDERRMVMSSGSDSVTVMDNLVHASVGDTLDLLPGCQHSASKCRNTFNNELNNGGFYFIPSKNPFMVSLLG